MSSRKLRWVSPVGDNPATGGGVAKAVQTFKTEGIFDDSAHYLSLLGKSKWTQLILALKDLLAYRYRRYVIHSLFSPYSLVILCFPFKGVVIFMPHGELKAGAIAINSKYKKNMLRIIRLFWFVNKYLKKISIVASNYEEVGCAKKILPLDEEFVLSDLVGKKVMLSNEPKLESQQGFNLIVLARLVENKGVADFLISLSEFLSVSKYFEAKRIDGVHLFVAKESANEANKVYFLKQKLQDIYGLNCIIYEDYERKSIQDILQDIPNKVPFLSSRFESFSYTLLEMLGFEYQPVVWFDNELVQQLKELGLCVQTSYGVFNPELWMYQNTNSSIAFIERLSHETKEEYHNVFRRLLR